MRGQDRATDAATISRSFDEPGVFEAIFERHFDPVHRYAQRRVGRDLADEVTAETFARAFEGRRRYDLAYEDARPWLLGIAAKLIARHWETERRRLAAHLRASPPVPGIDGGPGEIAGDVIEALDALGPNDREAILLLVWADLSYEEIAVALAVPVGTVRSRLARARRRMQELLAPSIDLRLRLEGRRNV